MRLMKTAAAVGIVVLQSARALHAQEPPRGQDAAFVHSEGARIVLRPDGNYVFNFVPASDLVFEAWAAPDVHIVGNVSAKLEDLLNGTRKRLWAYSVFGTFMVRLRMFDEDSNPVRTPSYMPKATVQIAAFRDISRALDTDRPDRRVSMWLLDFIPFGHHSNGQNGCLFVEATSIDGDCVGDEGIPPDQRTINTRDGSFSTNYFRIGAQYRRMYLKSAGDIPFAVTRWQWNVGVDAEINPTWHPIGGAISDELHSLYGPTRVGVSAGAARLHWKRFGRIEGKVGVEYIRDAPRGVSDVTTRFELILLPRGWGGAGIFARSYHGQDYYNLAFEQNITRLQFGLAFNQDKFLMFRQHLR